MPKKYLKKLDIKLVKGEYESPVKGEVRFPEQIYKVFSGIKDKAQETLIGVYLDENLEVKAYDVLGLGTENGLLVSVRDIFGRGLMIKSYTLILVHNHPSGKAEPSEEDKGVMEKLKIQAKTMDMSFLDFIIVGDMEINKKEKDYWSMFEEDGGGEYTLGGTQ